MKKVKVINKKELYVESEKAVQVAVDTDNELHKNLPKEYKLRILKERKKETTSIEEYEELVKLENQLEKEIRFNPRFSLVPEQFKEMISRNLQVEESEVKQLIKETKAELKNQIPYLKDTLLPLVTNLHTLRAVGITPSNVRHILKAEYQEGITFKLDSIVRPVNLTYYRETINELNSIIQKIENLK